MINNKLKLEFRAKLPDGTYFYQEKQYLTSFLRRLLLQLKVSHPSYLEKNLEEYLEVKIDNKWIQCK